MIRKFRTGLALLAALCLLLAGIGAAEQPETSVAMLRNGGSFVLVVREDGTILGWGDNRKGQLGTKHSGILTAPETAAAGLNGKDLADIQCGNENTLFLMKDGTVYTCGTNGRGCQGLGNLKTHVREPRRIPGLEHIVQIACGFGHNAALDADGHVWVWGRNDHGQLGIGSKGAKNTPVKLELEGIVRIACGGKFTLAQDRDGRLWGWGSNTHQVLQEGAKQACLRPVALAGFEGLNVVAFGGGSDVAFWLDDQGNLWGRGRNEFRQVGSRDAAWKISPKLTRVDIPEKVVSVCAYSAITSALTESGNMYIWGSGSSGALGDGTAPGSTYPMLAREGDAAEIAMGSLISSVRTKDGNIYVTGYNKYGQLGNGTTKTSRFWVNNGTNVYQTVIPGAAE